MSSYLIPISCLSIIKANSKNYTSMYLWAVSSNSTITSKKTAAVSRHLIITQASSSSIIELSRHLITASKEQVPDSTEPPFDN
jgi:hypothetical protein